MIQSEITQAPMHGFKVYAGQIILFKTDSYDDKYLVLNI
jgi:hypothetical protein